jgi:FkbM family methyltransferase
MSDASLSRSWAHIREEIRLLVSKNETRDQLNYLYRDLSFPQMQVCHNLFAKIFRGVEVDIEEGNWVIDFLGQEIVFSLRKEQMWLDWDTALSTLGHEPEIKGTYAAVLKSAHRPKLFVDVGANYGTHSLLFSAHGIETLSFEPNEGCHLYLRELFRTNNLEAELHPVALSDKPGTAILRYPERDTWLGTTCEDYTSKELRRDSKLLTQQVLRGTLDAYLGSRAPVKMMLKIDTEGSELPILKGASQTIAVHRPMIVFEGSRKVDRKEMFDLFEEMQYRVFSLPWSPSSPGAHLAKGEFVVSRNANFIAVPFSVLC